MPYLEEHRVVVPVELWDHGGVQTLCLLYLEEHDSPELSLVHQWVDDAGHLVLLVLEVLGQKIYVDLLEPPSFLKHVKMCKIALKVTVNVVDPFGRQIKSWWPRVESKAVHAQLEVDLLYLHQ